MFIDRESLDSAYPAKFGTQDGFLFVPANYGQYSQVFPSGGFLSNTSSNQAIAYLRSQAAVISDVDTPTDGNVTVLLSVDKGLLLLQEAVTQVRSSSPSSLYILVADSWTTSQMMLVSALTALGHRTDTVTSGQAAFDAVVARYDPSSPSVASFLQSQPLPADNKHPEQYDAVVMAESFLAGSGQWDGLQAIRMIRQWEAQNLNHLGTDGNSTSARSVRIPIIGLGARGSGLVGDEQEMLAAGADVFLTQPEVDYVPASELASPVTLSVGLDPSTQELFERASEQQEVNQLALTLTSFLFRSSRSLNVTVLSPPTASQLPDLTALQSLRPGPVFSLGSQILLEGNLTSINAALTGLFLLATNDTRGSVTLTLTVTDRPGPCLLPPTSSRPSSPFALHPLYPVVPTVNVSLSAYSYFNFTSSLSVQSQQARLCDTSPPRTSQATIAVFVVAVNQPPSVSGGPVNLTFTAAVDTIALVAPALVVADADHLAGLTDPLPTEDMQPPVGVRLSVQLGRLSLPLQAGLTFLQGTGYQDRVLSVLGAIGRVNAALAAIQYTCRSADGCASGLTDSLVLTVNDEGFSGKGGPLKATIALLVSII